MRELAQKETQTVIDKIAKEKATPHRQRIRM